MKYVIPMAIAAMGLAHGALAVEVTGGTAEIGYSTFTSNSNVSRTFGAGGLEVGFTRAFSLQFDLAFYGFNAVNDTGRSATIHSIYHVNDTTSLGFFIGNDDVSGIDANFYGIEGGFELETLDAELYLASGDDNGISGSLMGVSLKHDLGNSFGLTGQLDHADFNGGIDFTRFSVGVSYDLSPTAVLYGEVGSLSASALGLSGSESFIGIGARINFGADRGVTFKRRGLLEFLPGG